MDKNTININIQNLIGTLVVVQTNPKEASAEIEASVTEALLRAVNAASANLPNPTQENS